MHERKISGVEMSWSCQSLQSSIFFDGSATVDALGPWLKVFGSPPLQFNQNPSAVPPNAVAQGATDNYSVVLSANIGRLDLVLSPKMDDAFGQGVPFVPIIPVIEEPEAALRILKGYTSQIIPASGLNRLAFVANLQEAHADLAEASAAFFNHIGVEQRFQNAQDLSFQVNVRQDIVNNLAVNRVCRWSVVEMQAMFIQFNGMSVPLAHSTGNPLVTFTVDVNTVPNTNLSGSPISSVLDGLANEALEIISSGYGALYV